MVYVHLTIGVYKDTPSLFVRRRRLLLKESYTTSSPKNLGSNKCSFSFVLVLMISLLFCWNLFINSGLAMLKHSSKSQSQIVYKSVQAFDFESIVSCSSSFHKFSHFKVTWFDSNFYLKTYELNHCLPQKFRLRALNRFNMSLIWFVKCLRSLTSRCRIVSKFLESYKSSSENNDLIQRYAYVALFRFILHPKLFWFDLKFLSLFQSS